MPDKTETTNELNKEQNTQAKNVKTEKNENASNPFETVPQEKPVHKDAQTETLNKPEPEVTNIKQDNSRDENNNSHEPKQDKDQNKSNTEVKKLPKPAPVPTKIRNTQLPVKPSRIGQWLKSIRVTALFVSMAFGVLITGGGIYYSKYPNGYTKPAYVPLTLPQVLSVTKEEEQFTVFSLSTQAPAINAKANGVYFRDKTSNTGFIKMAEINQSSRLPFASITKLMTALVALDLYELDREVTVPSNCVNLKDLSNAGFKAGDVVTVQDLIYGTLVKSGADASCVLASIDKAEVFVQKMNEKAAQLGMNNTKFQNVIGSDAGDLHYSSIEDLKILSEETLKSSILRKIIGTQVIEIKPKNSVFYYKFENTNDLLKNIPGTIGIKTGNTEMAKECLTYLYSDNKHEIMIIILGSEKRFEDTKTLLDWARNELKNQK